MNDSVFDDSGPFSDTPDGAGVSLDQALREFGPAAIDDLIPRLRALAAALDHAHAAGFVHGRLHPSKVLVTDDGTYVMGRRVPASTTLTREADQYALATIAYEWMFGRPISGTGDRPVDVRSIPGVDRAALSRAFTRALSPEPSRRFASCSDFVDALAATVTPSLPLMAVDDDDDDPVGPFLPEEPAAPVPIVAAESVPDLSFLAEEPTVMAAEPDLDAMGSREPFDSARESAGVAQGRPGAGPPSLEERATARSRRSGFSAAEAKSREPEVESREAEVESREAEVAAIAVPSWQSSADQTQEKSGNRFSGFALILAAIVGMVAGFAAGYMARPRALQSGPPQEMAAGTEAPLPGAQGAQGAQRVHKVRGVHKVRRGCPKHPHPVHLVHPVHPQRSGAFW